MLPLKREEREEREGETGERPNPSFVRVSTVISPFGQFSGTRRASGRVRSIIFDAVDLMEEGHVLEREVSVQEISASIRSGKIVGARCLF